MSNFDDLAMAVASFGGNNAVKFDDLGMPSIMVGIPKMKYSDIITGGTQEKLPGWIAFPTGADAPHNSFLILPKISSSFLFSTKHKFSVVCQTKYMV